MEEGCKQGGSLTRNGQRQNPVQAHNSQT